MADIWFQDVSNHGKSTVWAHFCFNKAQQTPKSNLCVVTLKADSFKHRKFNKSFEMKAQNSGTGRDPITNCKKRNYSFWGYKKEAQ